MGGGGGETGGDHLVDGAADAEVAAGGFAGLFAGEERGGGARVVAGTVAVAVGFFVSEAGDDLDVGFVGFEGG